MQLAVRQSTATLDISSIVLAFPNFRSGETSMPTDVHLTSLRSDRNSTPGRPSRCGGGRHPRQRPPPPGSFLPPPPAPSRGTPHAPEGAAGAPLWGGPRGGARADPPLV